jgi:hypothetical protein
MPLSGTGNDYKEMRTRKFNLKKIKRLLIGEYGKERF